MADGTLERAGPVTAAELSWRADWIRLNTVRLIAQAGLGYYASMFSCAEIIPGGLAALRRGVLRVRRDPPHRRRAQRLTSPLASPTASDLRDHHIVGRVLRECPQVADIARQDRRAAQHVGRGGDQCVNSRRPCVGRGLEAQRRSLASH